MVSKAICENKHVLLSDRTPAACTIYPIHAEDEARTQLPHWPAWFILNNDSWGPTNNNVSPSVKYKLLVPHLLSCNRVDRPRASNVGHSFSVVSWESGFPSLSSTLTQVVHTSPTL